jgi:DNA-binding transcriptional regulator YiaG
MPNIGTVLREEIARLSRKESRGQIGPTKKATAQHRKDIALLKRQVAQLERQIKLYSRKTVSVSPMPSSAAAHTKVRFAAKGLRSERNRLALSAGDFGKLVGVSAQSVYNWEREKARPRGKQLSKLTALRGIGKRVAEARLKQLAEPKGKVKHKK